MNYVLIAVLLHFDTIVDISHVVYVVHSSNMATKMRTLGETAAEYCKQEHGGRMWAVNGDSGLDKASEKIKIRLFGQNGVDCSRDILYVNGKGRP